MRVLIAPDSFGGTLTAAQAADAIAAGWARTWPRDQLVRLPLADGGTGFVEVLHAARGGTTHEVGVTGPDGAPVTAVWLEQDDTAYVESATACGLHLVGERTPAGAASATSRGVGELVADALAHGVARVVVGLGGSASTDGGAGMLAALGATPRSGDGAALPDGGGALARVATLDGFDAARAAVAGVELVVAADVDNPLLGETGAAHVYGPQKGADPATVDALDAALGTWAAVLDRAAGRPGLAEEPGAGAAGGLGAALAALGARRESGGALVREVAGFDAALAEAHLVVTGEGRFDGQSLRGKLVTVVSRQALAREVPCIVVAGQSDVSVGEALEVGVHGVYTVAANVGSVEAAFADPSASLADLAAGVAEHWGARPRE